MMTSLEVMRNHRRAQAAPRHLALRLRHQMMMRRLKKGEWTDTSCVLLLTSALKSVATIHVGPHASAGVQQFSSLRFYVLLYILPAHKNLINKYNNSLSWYACFLWCWDTFHHSIVSWLHPSSSHLSQCVIIRILMYLLYTSHKNTSHPSPVTAASLNELSSAWALWAAPLLSTVQGIVGQNSHEACWLGTCSRLSWYSWHTWHHDKHCWDSQPTPSVTVCNRK